MASGPSANSETISELKSILNLFEQDRLNSFTNWQYSENENCCALEMAKAGFYFTGSDSDDSATCFVCGKVLDGWESTDDPWIEHNKHSANCKFIKLKKAEEDMIVEEFLDLCLHVIKQYIASDCQKKEAKFVKTSEIMRDVIKNPRI